MKFWLFYYQHGPEDGDENNQRDDPGLGGDEAEQPLVYMRGHGVEIAEGHEEALQLC